MSVWFTSDLHLGHRMVASLRGFGYGDDPTVAAAHDIHLMSRWHDTVKPDDIVWVLGDLSAGGTRATEQALYYLRDLPGRKRLIAGNHDPIHPMNRQAPKWFTRFAEVFEFVAPFARTKVRGREVLLSHFPYHVDRDKPRYLQYRLRDEGGWLLHGHLHCTERVTSDREIHVGVDAWGFAPVHMDQLASLMSEPSEFAQVDRLTVLGAPGTDESVPR